MLGSMYHETFYSAGSYTARDLDIVAGWVALGGSSSDCQPISNERGDIVLILAGECFSDPDVRWQLKQRGHEFRGTNAEWLVHAYEEQGQRFFENLNGVFSGLLIDHRLGKAFLFNDRYGMERVYYHVGNDVFVFASEAKALLRILPELRAFDHEGLAEFLTFGSTLDHHSVFRNVKILPGGSLWTLDGIESRRTRYFSPSTWEAQSTLSPDSFAHSFERIFNRILPRYLECDSPVGISLTGGLDTRMIMACRPDKIARLLSYTFAGVEGDTFDVRLARQVASACNLPHQVLRIREDFFSTFGNVADRTVHITDGCLGITGTHELYLNSAARSLAPLRLTGNFGSEILRGTTTFKPLGLSGDLFHPDFRRALRMNGVTRAADTGIHPVSFAAFKEIPWHLFGTVKAANSQLITRTPYLDNELVELAFRAPRNGHGSLPAALALIRQHRDLAHIPTDRGSILRDVSPVSLFRSLYRAISFKLDYWCNDAMPNSLLSLDPVVAHLASALSLRPHRYLTYRRWFRKELAGYLREQFADCQNDLSPFWSRPFVEGMLSAHITGRRNHIYEINAVLTVAAMERLLLRQSPEPTSLRLDRLVNTGRMP